MSEYGVHDYGRMIADEPRLRAWLAALEAVIRPGAVVAELGTGTGFFAVKACQLGARRVFAVEPADAIEVARDVVRHNGVADRVELFHARSTEIELPERADVIISDMRGVLPLYGAHLPSIADARRRLLAPGGQLVARADTIFVAVVEAADGYRELGLETGRVIAGVDMEIARAMDVSTWYRRRAKPEQLVSAPAAWARIDYAAVEEPTVRGKLEVEAVRDATAHGLAVWFESDLADGIVLSNAPGQAELVYANAFFPWPEPVRLTKGDRVSIDLDAFFVGDDYQWRWRTRLPRGAAFDQSTFFATPLAPGKLRKTAATHVPALGRDGLATRFVLLRIDGARPLGEIADALNTELPGRFSTRGEALAFVADVAARYG